MDQEADKTRELISVIIPVYKVEEYLERCVDSVLAQTYENLEILLVDDGSPDGCPALCDQYEARDPRVRVIHQQNLGLSGARNTGIQEAKGTWLSFIDSDDYVAADFIQSLYEACIRTGSPLSLCRWAYVHGEALPKLGQGSPLTGPENGQASLLWEKGRPGCVEPVVYGRRELMEQLYEPDGAYFVVAWNKLYRRELFAKIRYPLGQIHEDEATTHQIFHLAGQGAFVDRALYGYFVAPQSITRGFNPRRLDWIKGVSDRLEFFEAHGYETLMPRALQAFADGMIDIYFGLVDFQPENREEQKRIQRLVDQGRKRVRPYGRFPFRTALGYWLFIHMPRMYRKLLDQVKSESGKQ
ncbi:MAG: glycosyltransferase [Lachnospiraceae bacterium]|nr:glycosyltransferase [Lachnospiraceae bacterium]